jgi:hypothetical protein
MRWLLVLLIGCHSYVTGSAPEHSTFVPTAGAARAPQIATRAITIRSIDGVLAAGGVHLGVVTAEGSGSAIRFVRDAAWAAALAGGTHIILRDSKVIHVDSTTQLPGIEARNPGVKRDEVRVVFDVFRVERDHWNMLEPQLRPTATPER